jgi:hypothetical protein
MQQPIFLFFEFLFIWKKKIQTWSHLLFCLLSPALRVITYRPQLATLATNRGIATAFCLAGSARFTSAGYTTIKALSGWGTLARDRYFGLGGKGLIRKNGGSVGSFCAECRGRICDRGRVGGGKGDIWIWELEAGCALRSLSLVNWLRRRFLDCHNRKSAG